MRGRGRALGKGSWDLFADIGGISLETSMGSFWGNRWDLFGGIDGIILGESVGSLLGHQWDLGFGAKDIEAITRYLNVEAKDLGIGAKDSVSVQGISVSGERTRCRCKGSRCRGK